MLLAERVPDAGDDAVTKLVRPWHDAILFLISCDFIPSIIAAARGKRSTAANFAVNLLLAWTFIGWVAALVCRWSASSRPSGSR